MSGFRPNQAESGLIPVNFFLIEFKSVKYGYHCPLHLSLLSGNSSVCLGTFFTIVVAIFNICFRVPFALCCCLHHSKFKPANDWNIFGSRVLEIKDSIAVVATILFNFSMAPLSSTYFQMEISWIFYLHWLQCKLNRSPSLIQGAVQWCLFTLRFILHPSKPCGASLEVPSSSIHSLVHCFGNSFPFQSLATQRQPSPH